MYKDYTYWKNSIKTGREILKNRMRLKENEKVFSHSVVSKLENLLEKRQKNKLMKVAWEKTLDAIEQRKRKEFNSQR